MIQLKTWQLQEFAKTTSAIQDSGALPILEYLKLSKNGILTKNNIAMVCNMQIDCYPSLPDKDILIHKDTLFTLVNKTKAEIITIETKNGNIIISDGKTKLNHQIENPEMYPSLPDIPSIPGIKVTQPVIDAIKTAQGFISPDENAANFRAVHIKDTYIAAFNFSLLYIKEFSVKFPDVILTAEMCNIITQFSNLDFFETERHYFFKASTRLMFIFTKTEYLPLDVVSKLKVLKSVPNDKDFKIFKQDIIEFCEIANNLTSSKTITCTIGEDENGSFIERQDTDYAKGGRRELVVVGIVDEFTFNSKLALPGFKALKQDQLSCRVVSNALIINSDNSYAVFMAVQK